MISLTNESIYREQNTALKPEETPFSKCYAACEAGDIEQVKACITKDISLISQRNSERQTLMHIAAEHGHLVVVEWLHEKDPSLIDQVDKNQLTPLHQAAFHEEISILKVFIKKLKENTALIQQIAQKNCPKTLAFILEQGVDPNSTNSSKQTLLHLAAEAGQEKNVLCLVQHGAKIDALDRSKRTPIFLAVIQGHHEVVKLLIQNKADLTIVNEGKETVLHVAALYGHMKILKNLLGDPVGKSLIEAKDHDGKTPMHKAAWGDPKPNIVTLLLISGANPNAKNSYGYTPLHWATKHGHVKSAQIFLKSGNSMEAVNDNNNLPFDLAIRFDQDDFIRFFLGTEEKLQIGKPSSDLEGFYSKCLLQAKKQNLVGEQILYLLKLSAIYIEKAEVQKGKKENYLVGAKILNCALALLDKENHCFENYLLKRIEEVEKLFFKSQGIDTPIKINATQKRRDRLIEIRKAAAESDRQAQPIQETLQQLTESFKQLLSELIVETQELLGPAPVTWACIGMGSMSRGEMCPYSDIEFAFLIEKESSKALAYFRTLSKILEIKVINLGETKFPVFGGGYESPTPDGFCMDSAGNTPLGVTGVYELIGTPQQLAQFQSVKWIERNIILPNAMSNVCLVSGSKKLEASYNKQKKKVQQLQEKKEGTKNNEELAMRLLGGHLIEFSPDLSVEKEKETAFGVKKELYRPFQEILGCLSLLYDLKEKSTFGRIDELMQLNVFSLEGAGNLKKAINQVLSLRLQVHLFYKDEKEFLCHPEEGKLQDPSLYYFTEQNIVYLHEIYKILLPFHKAASEFYRTKNTKDWSKNSFYDDSPSVQGVTFEKTLQYAKAQEAYQNAVSLNPNDIDAQLNLGTIEEKMGKSKEALPRNLKALTLAQQKHGENHPDVATSYNNIGVVYDTLGEFDKALEFHQKALKIRIQVFGENHPDVAISYNNIGMVYDNLGESNKALEFFQKDLKISLQVLGENHPNVATSYNNIGMVYKTLGESNKALEFHQKALKIFLQVLGENHPAVATSYNNIGNVYDNLGEYDKALEFYQKDLKINLEVLSDNHPDVAGSYNNIGAVYDNLGDSNKALEFFQKALKIQLQVAGENHPSVALSYNNIGVVYKTLGDSNKALEFHQEALKIQLQVAGENHPSVALSYNNIGTVYKTLGEFDKALEFHQKALKIRLQVLGENHPFVAISYNNIGNIYDNLGEYNKALEFFQKALKIKLLVLDENHPDVALSYNNIGNIYDNLGEYNKALEFFQKALKIFLKAYGKNHPHIEVVMKSLITYAKEAFSSQVKALREVSVLCTQILGEQHSLAQELAQLVE